MKTRKRIPLTTKKKIIVWLPLEAESPTEMPQVLHLHLPNME